MRSPSSRRVLVGVLAFVALLGACSDGDGGDGGDGGDAATEGSLGVASLPPVATTAATSASTTPATTTAPAATVAPVTAATSAPTTVAPTAPPVTTVAATAPPTTPSTTTSASTTPAGPPCVLADIVAQTQTQYEGITPSDVRCAGDWASWVGRPDDPFVADGYFAVARSTGGSWTLMNLGTAGICADAGVPADLWDPLGCFE